MQCNDGSRDVPKGADLQPIWWQTMRQELAIFPIPISLLLYFANNNNKLNNNTAGDAPYVNENILSKFNMKKLNRRSE